MSGIQKPRRPWVDGIIIGSTQAIILLLLVVVLAYVIPSQQQQSLDDIRASNRAIACVLLLPVDAGGRSEWQANSKCLIPNGLDPIDIDGNGRIDIQPNP
jgi:hypothetical protein